MCLLFLASTFLLVAYSADAHMRNSRVAKAVRYVPVQYGHMGADPNYLYGQQQTVQLPNGKTVTGYPVPPKIAYVQQLQGQRIMQQSTQPMAPGSGQQVMQPMVSRSGQQAVQPTASGPVQQVHQPTASGSGQEANQPTVAGPSSSGRQSQIVEYYGVAK